MSRGHGGVHRVQEEPLPTESSRRELVPEGPGRGRLQHVVQHAWLRAAGRGRVPRENEAVPERRRLHDPVVPELPERFGELPGVVELSESRGRRRHCHLEMLYGIKLPPNYPPEKMKNYCHVAT